MDLQQIDASTWHAYTDRAGYVGQIIKTATGSFQALKVCPTGELAAIGAPRPALDDAHEALIDQCTPARASCPNC
jgi:hypothetical protein